MDVDKGGEALAEPHGDLSLHVDGEGLEPFLEAAHGVVPKGTGIFAQVHASDLGPAQAAHRDEAWRKFTSGIRQEKGQSVKTRVGQRQRAAHPLLSQSP